MEANGGGSLLMRTACKTWGCPPCATSVLALFKARVEIGVSRLGRCAFITVTYRTRAGRRRFQTADVSGKDWRAFLRRLNHEGNMPNAWLKVTELTQQRVPHHHLLVGPISGAMRCYRSDTFDARRHLNRIDSCSCLSHTWSRNWLAVTGDSYICHVTPVLGPGGAGAYLGKYMAKNHTERELLGHLGYARRWSSSRTWPGGGRLRLLQTVEGGWNNITWTAMYIEQAEMDRNPRHLLQRTGENLTLALADKRSKRGAQTRLERFANVTIDRA